MSLKKYGLLQKIRHAQMASLLFALAYFGDRDCADNLTGIVVRPAGVGGCVFGQYRGRRTVFSF
jgi:hypothetical protein